MIFDSISMIQAGQWREAVIQILLTLPVIMFALAWHEAAHGYVAYKMGDPTARNLGRVTLNPAKHIDPIGFLAMLFVPGIGAFSIALPVALVNLFLNILPTLVLRYNTPKLKSMLLRLKRSGSKQN